MKKWVLWFLFGALYCCNVSAHDVFSGELKAKITEQKELSLSLSLAAVTAEVFTHDIINKNNQLSPANLPNIRDHLTEKAKSFFVISLDGVPLSPSIIDIELVTEDDSAIFTFLYPGPIVGELGIKSDFIQLTNREYKLTVFMRDANNVQLALLVQSYNDRFDLVKIDESASEVNQDGVFIEFLLLGFEHILIGIDHLLFLLALLVVCCTWKDAAFIITSFTIAHSITLSLAALGLLVLPSTWIELVIAMTVVYVASENLLSKHTANKRWLLTSLFGLVHGLGFANVLMELGLGNEGAPIVLPLVAFNLGVEIGQLLFATILLPILWYLQKYKFYNKKILPGISILIGLVGIIWIFERMLFLFS